MIPINISALSIQNNSFRKPNKQNEVSFKGDFTIGKNKREAARIVELFSGESKEDAEKLRDFALFCNENTPDSMKGYIDVTRKSNYECGDDFVVTVKDDNGKTLARANAYSTSPEYYDWANYCSKGDMIGDLFNEAKKRLTEAIKQAEECDIQSEQRRKQSDKVKEIICDLLAGNK